MFFTSFITCYVLVENYDINKLVCKHPQQIAHERNIVHTCNPRVLVLRCRMMWGVRKENTCVIHCSRIVSSFWAPCPLLSVGLVTLVNLVRTESYQVESWLPVMGGSREAAFSSQALFTLILST